MRRFILIPVCFVSLLVPVVVLASGGDGGFDNVVSSIESRYHAHATHIPFIAFVSFMARRATHDGVANMHVAEFEHFSAAIDGDELNSLVTQTLGHEWEPMIRETSRHATGESASSATGPSRESAESGSPATCPRRRGTEQTLIFTRPEGKRMGMFIVDLDNDDMDIVQLSVDPEHLNDSINRYDHHHDNAPGPDNDFN